MLRTKLAEKLEKRNFQYFDSSYFTVYPVRDCTETKTEK